MRSNIRKYKGVRISGGVQNFIKINEADKVIFDKYIIFVSGSAGKKRVKKVRRELLLIHNKKRNDVQTHENNVIIKN